MKLRIIGLVAVVAAQCDAQGPVMLRVHPHVGDTLRSVLEQTADVGNVSGSSSETPSRTVSTQTVVFSQTIVRSVQAGSSTVLTVVDSVRVRSTDDHAAKMNASSQRALEGQRLVLQIGADGAVESARDASGASVPSSITDAFASMPAILPKSAVSVGEQWTREMVLPGGSVSGSKQVSRVKATFRLDSLSRDGELAFVSMHGEIASSGGGPGSSLSGSIAGAIRLDRVRGWMTDSRFLVMLKSVVSPPAGTNAPVMRFTTRVSQRLRTLTAP